jgi:hypothetical protein
LTLTARDHLSIPQVLRPAEHPILLSFTSSIPLPHRSPPAHHPPPAWPDLASSKSFLPPSLSPIWRPFFFHRLDLASPQRAKQSTEEQLDARAWGNHHHGRNSHPRLCSWAEASRGIYPATPLLLVLLLLVQLVVMLLLVVVESLLGWVAAAVSCLCCAHTSSFRPAPLCCSRLSSHLLLEL